MPSAIDVSGLRFGSVVAISPVKTGRGRFWLCRCDCGGEILKTAHKLRGRERDTAKCAECWKMQQLSGDLRRKHGYAGRVNGKPRTRARLYRIWANMLSRCTNPKMTQYHRYGGRGISVCAEWRTFDGFRAWADASGYSDVLTIERKNVDGNYEPSNCEWITRSENARRGALGWRRRQKEAMNG
jgi:hypothetical protein